MTTIDTIRAWKDEEFRASASAEELAEHPSGLISLSDDDLDGVAGGLPKTGTGTGSGTCYCYC